MKIPYDTTKPWVLQYAWSCKVLGQPMTQSEEALEAAWPVVPAHHKDAWEYMVEILAPEPVVAEEVEAPVKPSRKAK